jgi:hypothetical protein
MEAFWPHRSSGNGRVNTRGPLRHNFIIPEMKVERKILTYLKTRYITALISSVADPSPGSGMGKVRMRNRDPDTG